MREIPAVFEIRTVQRNWNSTGEKAHAKCRRAVMHQREDIGDGRRMNARSIMAIPQPAIADALEMATCLPKHFPAKPK
ncbi:hypothetical protein [Cupriavidus basilensis]|uniref:Uncharacterized protein n=1 Tax=Cupriavidus basilensis TaxID=68895 RepID=A0A643FWB2_9BURK|nr:hypothetical protein [Cupriavidus basilensis]QOT76079.1 hypothetical protein F7R26_018305 [Cupriavidus basilensis]